MIDPSTLVLPDVVGAVMLRFRQFEARFAANGINVHPSPNVWTIAPDLSPDWGMPTWAITFDPAGGPTNGPWEGVPVHTQRFDLWFYGAGVDVPTRKRNAWRMWQVAHPIICPPAYVGLSRSFIAGHTVVMDVVQEAEPQRQGVPDTQWERVFCPYVVTYQEFPV